MDADALRAMQAPIKANLKDHPEAGRIMLKAEGQLGEGIACKIDTGKAIAEAGLHPATGGDGTQLCSGDMLLEALDIPIRDGAVRAEGLLDFRGTLGVDREAAVGFESISLTFDLDTDADETQLATLHKLTERYCVVLQTITGNAPVESRIETH